MRSNLFNLLGVELDTSELINIGKNPISWFEIPVVDMKRAYNFYTNVFGYDLRYTKLGEDEMYFFPMKKLGDGASGSLVKVKDNSPSKRGTLIYFYTKDFLHQIL